VDAGVQLVVPVPLWYVPGAQALHDAPAVAEYVPAAQAVHFFLSALRSYPAAQVVQLFRSAEQVLQLATWHFEHSQSKRPMAGIRSRNKKARR
jgi:hypothetical protein